MIKDMCARVCYGKGNRYNTVMNLFGFWTIGDVFYEVCPLALCLVAVPTTSCRDNETSFQRDHQLFSPL